MYSLLPLVVGFCLLSTVSATATIPNKIYGVNLGSWLVLEPWMLPGEWLRMGGQNCDNCADCIRSEFAFVQAYPHTADQKFNEHWNTWFTQDDVNELKSLGINTVRIPLGYWIVEALVDRRTEFYPRGGLKQLRRGLQQLKNAGIVAILDHHALPGVSSPNQMFAGRCTSDVEFYTDYNYHRALIWAAVMTGLSHLHPDFSTVFAIEAVNEPIMDANQTPGYGDYQKKFVETVRAMENLLGINVHHRRRHHSRDVDASNLVNVTSVFDNMMHRGPCGYEKEICDVLLEALPILIDISFELPGFSLGSIFGLGRQPPLMTNFMDVTWQFNNPSNPADAAIGPQGYDNHLYYNFGGVADPNPDAYLRSICNLQRVQNAVKNRNIPLWFGEWGLPTQFNATDEFLVKWADAQKLAYSKSAGWIFWNFKIEKSKEAGDEARQWSYTEGVRRGYFLRDPAAVHDPNVCDPYIGPASSTAATSTTAATSSTPSTTANSTIPDSTTANSTVSASIIANSTTNGN
ncbi:glycoside hydrolase family 5 protein [Dendrothele bispora CBS 962.96]|uniref:Glycoside hydrolase family 5 protein n=1 Tax=Dendrothele bispora (strain CBS 962.96) TaxID=1314807 RepID=A0A4S8L9P7_DENBC|nr:glycoside hydrolase family 5 protein [Dendrothele bispora CBS 962.96]